MCGTVTLTAQSDEVGLVILPLAATMREMVHLQVAATAAPLASPPITLQYLPGEPLVGFGLES